VKDIYDILREFGKRPGQRFALATLVRAKGSSYRRPGARMLICEDGHTVGSLSGGCLEEEVASHARGLLRTGTPVSIEFDTRRRFGCNGAIDIFIERIGEKLLTDISGCLNRRASCMIATVFKNSSVGEAARFPANKLGSRVMFPVEKDVKSPSAHKREADSFPYRGNEGCAFVQEIHPPIRVFIFGDGPDSEPLRRFGRLLGWQMIDLDEANALEIEPDQWTAAVVKSHNYGRDFKALQKMLPINLRYVGLVGPRQRRDQLLNDLLDVGVAINAGFFSPAGLDLRAESPEEIALAIVSEIQRVFAGGTGESLRERKISIHSPRENDSSAPRPAVVGVSPANS
jgi:xanthine/CO dehydrogenase XdhC/CoxF family maturation factor